MGTIRDLAKGLRKLDLKSQIPKIMSSVQDINKIIELNQRQLMRGKTSEGWDGANLRGYKTIEYAIYKNGLNSLPEFGIPDLKVTGAFYSGFSVKVTQTDFTITSNDPKALDLESKYTVNIYGLTGKSTAEYIGTVFYDKFKNYITSVTGLRFH